MQEPVMIIFYNIVQVYTIKICILYIIVVSMIQYHRIYIITKDG